ncbi:DUF3299 domain-containing protein [Aliidiomarina soli]|nr:DUF3299 domain-containing protein [Aliidiomarina soli]
MRVSQWVVLAGLMISAVDVEADTPVTIEWVELMPEHLLEALDNLPMLEHDYSDDAVDPFTDEWNDPYADAWNDILTSTEVVTRYADTVIRLPGYIVPLDIDDKQRVRSFFLVPYFGACIHVPPPPPNQLIYVDEVPAEVNLRVEDMYTAYWLTGRLSLEINSHELGTAAYRVKMQTIELYQYQFDE